MQVTKLVYKPWQPGSIDLLLLMTPITEQSSSRLEDWMEVKTGENKVPLGTAQLARRELECNIGKIYSRRGIVAI